MKDYLPVLLQCPLFREIDSNDLPGLLACLGSRITTYRKSQSVFQEGDKAIYVGIVLTGSVQVEQTDYYGNRSILGRAAAGELFSESFACAGVESLPVCIVATEDSQVMLIDCQRITQSCSNACGFHSRLILNLLQVMAEKNLSFHQKLEIIAKRTTREKLMTYLLLQAKHQGANSFTIPFDRQELADYLGVERSAMSAEISKLRADGILDCHRSHFTLL